MRGSAVLARVARPVPGTAQARRLPEFVLVFGVPDQFRVGSRPVQDRFRGGTSLVVRRLPRFPQILGFHQRRRAGILAGRASLGRKQVRPIGRRQVVLVGRFRCGMAAAAPPPPPSSRRLRFRRPQPGLVQVGRPRIARGDGGSCHSGTSCVPGMLVASAAGPGACSQGSSGPVSRGPVSRRAGLRRAGLRRAGLRRAGLRGRRAGLPRAGLRRASLRRAGRPGFLQVSIVPVIPGPAVRRGGTATRNAVSRPGPMGHPARPAPTAAFLLVLRPQLCPAGPGPAAPEGRLPPTVPVARSVSIAPQARSVSIWAVLPRFHAPRARSCPWLPGPVRCPRFLCFVSTVPGPVRCPLLPRPVRCPRFLRPVLRPRLLGPGFPPGLLRLLRLLRVRQSAQAGSRRGPDCGRGASGHESSGSVSGQKSWPAACVPYGRKPESPVRRGSGGGLPLRPPTGPGPPGIPSALTSWRSRSHG